MAKSTWSDLFTKHQQLLNEAVEALSSRQFFSPYPEHPKAYDAELDAAGKEAFGRLLNKNFTALNQPAEHWIGEEVSPFWQMGLGVQYPSQSAEAYVSNAQKAFKIWRNTTIETRVGILIESLERVRARFFELGYANMHTSGQTFLMSFQASGPHAADRALEAVTMGYKELSRYPNRLRFSKPLGKFNLEVTKEWLPVSKGVGLVIGCSTFPTWNTVPGVYANLVCGNTVIIKPHPKSILPIAIFTAELRKLWKKNGFPQDAVQLAVDTPAKPITKELAEHDAVSLIDYTGSNSFGDYVESLGKEVFTEKSGVNSVIIDSVENLKETAQNIAFSISLYSGQMCTAPQNIFIAEEVKSAEETYSYNQVIEAIKEAVKGVINHPKMGAGTLATIQNDATVKRIEEGGDFGGEILLEGSPITNTEFGNARVKSPTLIATDTANTKIEEECFGPLVFLVKTKNTKESVTKAAAIAKTKGAITCLAFSTDKQAQELIKQEMNAAFTPVSLNMKGAGFVNQHAAFSDLHVSGGNPAGNASFADSSYLNRRFVWVGNRWME